MLPGFKVNGVLKAAGLVGVSVPSPTQAVHLTPPQFESEENELN